MSFIAKVKRQEPGIYRVVYRMAKGVFGFRLPAMRPLGAFWFYGRGIWGAAWRILKNAFVYEQALRYRCTVGKHVRLDGDMPLILGDGQIHVGDNVVVSNRNTWIAGLKVYENARIEIGDRTILGYLNLISCAKSVRIGNDCLFAGEVKIMDNNSHSLDFEDRRRNAPLAPADVAPVVIEDDVWVGTNCIILKGVTIGRGAVVAAGAVVTRSVPPFTVVAGNPARVIKQIEPHFSHHEEANVRTGTFDVHPNHR